MGKHRKKTSSRDYYCLVTKVSFSTVCTEWKDKSTRRLSNIKFENTKWTEEEKRETKIETEENIQIILLNYRGNENFDTGSGTEFHQIKKCHLYCTRHKKASSIMEERVDRKIFSEPRLLIKTQNFEYIFIVPPGDYVNDLAS